MLSCIASLARILTCALVFVASVAAAEPLRAKGTWSATSSNASGTWEGQFEVAGADLVGEMALVDFPNVSGGKLAGTLESGQINFGIVFDDHERVTFTGVTDGTTLRGTFTSDGLSGTWNGTYTTEPKTPSLD